MLDLYQMEKTIITPSGAAMMLLESSVIVEGSCTLQHPQLLVCGYISGQLWCLIILEENRRKQSNILGSYV